MLKREIRLIAFAFLALPWGSMAHAQEAFTIDVPGATFTRVLGLNAQGDVCGGILLNGARLAFAGSRQAEFTDLETFAYPGAVLTQCRGINAAGQMVGGYQSNGPVSLAVVNHAFVKDGEEFISCPHTSSRQNVLEGKLDSLALPSSGGKLLRRRIQPCERLGL